MKQPLTDSTTRLCPPPVGHRSTLLPMGQGVNKPTKVCLVSPSAVLESIIGRTTDNFVPSASASYLPPRLLIEWRFSRRLNFIIPCDLGLHWTLDQGTVPWIISLSRQSPFFLSTCPKYKRFLCSINPSRLFSTPAVTQTILYSSGHYKLLRSDLR